MSRITHVSCSFMRYKISALLMSGQSLQELDTTLQVLGIDERGEGCSLRLTTSPHAPILPRASKARAAPKDVDRLEATFSSRLRYLLIGYLFFAISEGTKSAFKPLAISEVHEHYS